MVPAASPTNCRMFNFLGQVPSTSPRDQVPSCYFRGLGACSIGRSEIHQGTGAS